MLSKGKTSSPDSFDTLIGINSKFEGNIELDGTIRVDGKILGNLKINGDVYIGKDAVVTGNIIGINVYVSGKVEGNIEAKGILKVYSSGKIKGDITVQNLITEEGSSFDGKCTMLTAKQAEDTSSANNSKKSK